MSETSHSPDFNPASQRHWLYGFNAALLVLVGMAIVGFLMYICEVGTKEKVAWDLSSNAVNSLSSSTKALLKEIDASGKDYQLVTLFTDPTPNEKANGDPDKTAEKRRQVMDLLRLYARNSSHVTVEDQGDAASEDIERRIRERYKNELKPYEEEVSKFDQLARDFKNFLSNQEAAIAGAAAAEGATAEDRDAAASMQAAFRQLPPQIDQLLQKIHREQNEVLPQWGDLTDNLKTNVEDMAKQLALFADPAKLKQQELLPAGILAYLTKNNADYKKIADAFTSYKVELDKLQPLKVQDVISNLHRNSVVVLGPDSAKILSRFEIFDSTPSRDNPDTPTTTFKGEEIISSALLAMSHPDKVKVVFVTPSMQRLLDGDYSDMAATLREANFDVLEWSPPNRSPNSPPPSDTEPPAIGKGVVWVVFPPDFSNMQMMMAAPPDATAVAEAVQKHLAQGGHVLFLASSGSSPFAAASGYPYDAALKDFGINVLAKYTVVRLVEAQNRATGEVVEQAAPYIDLQHYESSKITDALQSLPIALYPASEVTAVELQKPAPAGVTTQVLIQTPRSPDYFATTSAGRTPKFNKDTDMAAPVPIAALAIKNAGQKDAEQRVMVVGCKGIASNTVLEARQAMMIGNQIVPVPIFPGNEEFTRNSILWLAGYQNMIAVSSKTNAATRIVVSPNALTLVRVIVLVGAPMLALVLGGLVWAVRRR
jgi:hypothetical protein